MATAWEHLVKILKPPKPKKTKAKTKTPVLSENECLVCLETVQCLSTSQCNHPICVRCLGTYIAVTHNSRMPCPCPSSAICKAKFTIDDIAPFVDDAEIGRIWLCQAEIQIEKGLGMYCPNQQCSKPILWSAKIGKKKKIAGKCRGCGQPVCIPCKSAYHTHLTYSLRLILD